MQMKSELTKITFLVFFCSVLRPVLLQATKLVWKD